MKIPMKSHVIQACFALAFAGWIAGTGADGPLLRGETVFDVRTYGAKADGITDNSMELIQTWNAACASTGRAKVVIPVGNFTSGEVVFLGPCRAPPPITFEIQGTLTAIPDLTRYSHHAWIMFQKVDKLIVTGGGTINGNGPQVWKYDAGGHTSLPVSLALQTVGNSRMENLKFVNSMGFHSKATDSHDIIVKNLTITAPGDSPNTDGFHVSRSANVIITDCTIGTGDDCVSIGEGSRNISVSRITCGPGHGISIGSLGKRLHEHNVHEINVTNCTLTGTTNGARIKTFHNSPRLFASGIVFQDLVLNGVQNPIIIDQHYNSDQTSGESNVKISDVHFMNIRGRTTSAVAIKLDCSLTNPCEGIELADIDLVAEDELIAPLTFSCSHAQTIQRGKLNPPPPPALCL